MALPCSGEIKMSQINSELNRSASATISLDAAENGDYGAINSNSASRPNPSNPAAMSEWHCYNHSAAGCNAPTITGTDRTSTSAILYISHSNCNAMEVQYSSNGGQTWTQEANQGCVTTKYVYSLSPSTTYLFRARIVCGGTGQYSSYSNVVTVTTCPASGTLASTYCSGCDYYERYYDASCNVYAVLVQSNSPNCGCGAPTETCFTAFAQAAGYYEGYTCDGVSVSGYARYAGQPIDCCVNFAAGYSNLDHQYSPCLGGCGASSSEF
jgi:hypothetical protein